MSPQALNEAQGVVNGQAEDAASAQIGDDDQGDPFLDELRRVTTEDPQNGDAIADFLDDKQERGSGGWFGRRK